MAFKLFDRIQETASTTGTGDFTLAGVIAGFKTFASRYSTGDTLYYCIQAVDGGGSPSGDWEVGLGTYSAANTLTRTTVLSSSNSDALVNFTSGEKRVFVTMTALQAKSIREKLTANRTYYVRSDGSDSNDGLANNSGGAFLTIQKAVDVLCGTLDMGIYGVTVQCNDATRTEKVVLKRYIGAVAPIILGNTTTPANCLMNCTSGECFSNSSLLPWEVKGFKLQTTTGGNCLSSAGGGSDITFYNIDFGACADTHIYARFSGVVTAATNYTISGSANIHFAIVEQGIVSIGGMTVTLTGTPAFAVAFCYGRKGHCLVQSMTFSGSATGNRINLSVCTTVFSNGAAEATYFPGNAAGTKGTGSEWV